MVGKAPDDLLWCRPDGQPLRPPTTTHWFGAAVKRCQAADPEFPRVTVHELRRTAASLMIASGANVKTVQSQLGHKTATMTLDQYGHLFPDDLDDVADKMDDLVWGVPKMCPRGANLGVKTPLNCMFLVELPGIEPASLPGQMPSEMRFRYVSFQFVPAEYRVGLYRCRGLYSLGLHLLCPSSGRCKWCGLGFWTLHEGFALPSALLSFVY